MSGIVTFAKNRRFSSRFSSVTRVLRQNLDIRALTAPGYRQVKRTNLTMPSDATRVFYVAGVTTGSRGRAKSAYHCLSFVLCLSGLLSIR